MLALHAGALLGHLLVSVAVQATHVPWVTLQTVLPEQAAFDWQPTQTCIAVLHIGIEVPAHWALLVHCTHVLVAVSQTLPEVHLLESAAVQITQLPFVPHAGIPLGQLLVSLAVQSTQAPLAPHTLLLGHSLSLLQPRHWLFEPHTGVLPVHSACEFEVHSTQVLLEEHTGSLWLQFPRSAVVHSTHAPELEHARFIGQLEPLHASQ